MAKFVITAAEMAQLPPKSRKFWKEMLGLERERERLTKRLAVLEARAKRKRRS